MLIRQMIPLEKKTGMFFITLVRTASLMAIGVYAGKSTKKMRYGKSNLL